MPKPVTVWITINWKILRETGIPDHLICLLRNLHADQEATATTGHGTTDWFQIGKGVLQGCILSPCLFNLYAEYIMRNWGLEEAKVRIKTAGRNIYNLRYADDTTLIAGSEEELKSLLMKVKEESENVGLKFNIQKTKIMAPGCITSWQIDGETVETVADFIFLGSKITVDGNCSHEIKRCLLLGRKVMTNLDSILKSITLSTKYLCQQRSIYSRLRFPISHVWMWELDYKESWEPKNWCFWTVVLEKTLESSLECKEIQLVHPKGDQSWMFTGGTDFEAEAPILWPPHVESWLTAKDPDAGKYRGQEEKGMTEDEMVGWHHRHNGHGFG